MTKVNIAIVGSRTFTDSATFDREMNIALTEWGLSTKNINRIVSGGSARGTDTLADAFAKNHGVALTVYIPDWKAFGKDAGIMRNTEIINDCDYIIAFPSQHGRGNQDIIRKAQCSNPPKKMKVVYISIE